jgi:hypothetical protein
MSSDSSAAAEVLDFESGVSLEALQCRITERAMLRGPFLRSRNWTVLAMEGIARKPELMMQCFKEEMVEWALADGCIQAVVSCYHMLTVYRDVDTALW